jgi:Na+-transporting NADH:ubiquinone oxidoreductase subunit NqrC
MQINAFRSGDGSWLIFDDVIGKHEFIDIAVAISSGGQVLGIEVLQYRETYGGEVRNPKWRAQFHGKTSASELKLDDDVRNISGATLSCRHITDGIKRLLHTWRLVLSKY